VRCGHLGCQKAGGVGVNGCSTNMTEANCVFHKSGVDTAEVLSKLEVGWAGVMPGIKVFLKLGNYTTTPSVVKQLRDKKSSIIAAIRAKVGTNVIMTPHNFQRIVVDAIKEAVPETYKVIYIEAKPREKKITIQAVEMIWEVMNSDLFLTEKW
jgi:hypothetical protein